ncbi:hypothetical protein B0H19DRAFT_1318674, partial [Mycena capillaripes]
KFDRDGNIQHFPGNTIISYISPFSHSELYGSFLALCDKPKNSHLSHVYVLLPPSSCQWHMTVFEGGPDDLPIDASGVMHVVKLSAFDLQCDPPSHLSVKGFYRLCSIIGLDLDPSAAEWNVRMRGLMSNVLRIRTGGYHPFTSLWHTKCIDTSQRTLTTDFSGKTVAS